MLIEKERINEAKEKLGDLNFDLIMDGLVSQGRLAEEDIDRKNMKCRCPFHAGDRNPSCSYDRKLYRMHCFGCNTNYSLIDMYMDEGQTFLDACQSLFKEAGVQYAFTEKNVRIQPKDYRYPTVPPKKERTVSKAYWEHRGISEGTLDYADVREDESGNSVFLVYDLNDVVTTIKYKPSHKPDKSRNEPKCWFQKGADKEDLLLGMNKINTSEPLYVTEGEADWLTMIELGVKNAVTPLNGAGSFGWVEHCWDFLEQFDNIIIISDNDGPGKHMREELLYRLGTWRCKFVEIPTEVKWENEKIYPVNDLNDFYLTYGRDPVLKAIANAKDTPVKSVTDYADIVGIDLSEMDGIETGLSAIDDELYKLYYGTLTILTGRPGSGKSSIINSILANAMQEGVPAWLFSREMPGWIVRSWCDLQLAGPRNVEQRTDKKGHVYYAVKPGVKSKINDWSRGKLFVYNDGEPNDPESLFVSMTSVVRKFGVHLLVLDNLMCITLADNGGNELKAQTGFITRLVDFAIKYRVAIILAAHPRKKATGEPANTDLTMDDVAGSANIVNLAHRSIALRRISQKEKESPDNKFSNYNVKVTITKDRLLGKNDVGFGLYYDIPSRRFFSNYDEYSFNYSWDSAEYHDPLPVPQCLIAEQERLEAEEEVFGNVY